MSTVSTTSKAPLRSSATCERGLAAAGFTNVQIDVKRLPSNVVPYHRTREFSELTVPDGLRRRHTTKTGVWARICVLEGSLRYRILEPLQEEHMLSAQLHGIVEPEIPHEVEPLGTVRFYVEFLRSPE